MRLSKSNRGVIRLGDTTSHGGKVVKVHYTPDNLGRPIACVGDLVECPKCSGRHTIVEGDPTFTIMGVPVALEGHKTSCGARLRCFVK